MIATLNSEWIKLRTVRGHWVQVAIAALFPIVVSLLTVGLSRTVDPDMLPRVLVGTAMVSLLMLSVLGSVTITGEFTYNTIRPTFAATPSRVKVLVAKALVMAVVSAAVVAVVLAVGYFGGKAIISARDLPFDNTDFPPGNDMMRAALANAPFYGVIGVGVGALIRNQAFSNTALVLWPMLVENLLTGLLGVIGLKGADRWMPYTASLRSIQEADSFDIALGRSGSIALFAGFAVALLVVGAWVVSRRDA